MRIVLQILLVLLSLIVILWLVRRTARNVRRLNEGIEQYRKEEEERVKTDPYGELSELFSDDSEDKRKGNN